MKSTYRLLLIFAEFSRLVRKAGPTLVKYKPLNGGPFGQHRYVIGSYLTRKMGLDDIVYFVAAPQGCAVIGFGDTKAAALETARLVLATASADELERYEDELIAEIQLVREQMERERDERRQSARSDRAQPSIPKRRREIFDKSGGKCHYCTVALTLDGKWHIEHMQPRALLGPNDKSNLVASCVSCNHKKRDKTAEEFIAQRAKESA